MKVGELEGLIVMTKIWGWNDWAMGHELDEHMYRHWRWEEGHFGEYTTFC